jgi:hypothetical protein
LTTFHTDRTDDEQFNDEKAYLIKQISELKDTKAWDTFSSSRVCVMCVNSSFFLFFLCVAHYKHIHINVPSLSFFFLKIPTKNLWMTVLVKRLSSLSSFFLCLSSMICKCERERERETKFCAIIALLFVCLCYIHCCPLFRHLHHLCWTDIPSSTTYFFFRFLFVLVFLFWSFNTTDRYTVTYCARPGY